MPSNKPQRNITRGPPSSPDVFIMILASLGNSIRSSWGGVKVSKYGWCRAKPACVRRRFATNTAAFGWRRHEQERTRWLAAGCMAGRLAAGSQAGGLAVGLTGYSPRTVFLLPMAESCSDTWRSRLPLGATPSFSSASIP